VGVFQLRAQRAGGVVASGRPGAAASGRAPQARHAEVGIWQRRRGGGPLRRRARRGVRPAARRVVLAVRCLPRADCIDGGTESRLESAMLPEVPAGVLEGSLQYAHARTCKPHLGACLPRFDGIDRLAGTVAVRAGLT